MKNDFYPLYELPKISDLKAMIRAKAVEIPDKIAFGYPRGRGQFVEKTFLAFYNEVNALGTWGYSQGFKGKHIAIIGENSYEWLLLFFAIVNGGSVAVPIDKELPPNEIMRLLKKADVEIVFCSTTYKDIFAEESGTTVYYISEIGKYIDEGQKTIELGHLEYVNYKLEYEKLCCIMFTSGTSGSSKGVMLSHRSFAKDINASCKLFVLWGNTLAVLPFHHAFGLVVSVFMVFNYGYTTYINKSLKTVKINLERTKPQTMLLVPLFVETFYRQIWDTAKKDGKEKKLRIMMKLSDILLGLGIDMRKRFFSTVRKAFGGGLEYIICGGADLGVKYIKDFRSWGIEILNGYGTTECSPCAAVNRNFHHKDGTVGLPIPGTEIKIADDGEVLISGAHVMLGYYKDQAATNEALHEGWYSTGDLGYIDSDGFLTLTGRKKNLIIRSNGENVSPEELEKDLLADVAVMEVVVYVEDDVIIAEIYPDSEYKDDKEYFDTLLKRVNSERPMYKQIGRIKLRDTEFRKNSSKKIIRYKD